MLRRSAIVIIFALACASVSGAQTPPAQTQPWKAKNLEFFPKDISRAELTQRMREFSLALGVRCQHCHTGGDGISFDGVIFDSDDKAPKRTARAMLKMMDQLNTVTLAQLPNRAEPESIINEYRERDQHISIGLTLKQSFGGSGGKAVASKVK